MSDDVSDAIEQAAQDPRRVKGDEGEVEAHPIKEQIDADKFLLAKAARRNRLAGFQFRRLRPPGAV
jgi:hypothetical protein